MIHPTPFLSIKVQKLVNEVAIPDIYNLSDPSLGHFGLREKRIYLFKRILRILFTLLSFGHVFDRRVIMFWYATRPDQSVSILDSLPRDRHSTADRGLIIIRNVFFKLCAFLNYLGLAQNSYQ